MTTKKNSEIYLRPRFSIDLEEQQEALIGRFEENLTDPNCLYCTRIVDAHIIIDVPPKEDHFWSPQLHIEIEENQDGTSVVKGLFGPKPQVWTMFMFVHFFVGGAFLVFSVMAYVKWSLGNSYFFPMMMLGFLALLWGVLYFLGKMGKSTGHDQMEELHIFMMQTLERK